jgi:prefoldin subunit 5
MKTLNHDQCRKEMDQVNSQLNRAQEQIKAISDDRQKLEQMYNQVNQELQNLKKMPSVPSVSITKYIK